MTTSAQDLKFPDVLLVFIADHTSREQHEQFQHLRHKPSIPLSCHQLAAADWVQSRMFTVHTEGARRLLVNKTSVMCWLHKPRHTSRGGERFLWGTAEELIITMCQIFWNPYTWIRSIVCAGAGWVNRSSVVLADFTSAQTGSTELIYDKAITVTLRHSADGLRLTLPA